jgi:hypothetical protein
MVSEGGGWWGGSMDQFGWGLCSFARSGRADPHSESLGGVLRRFIAKVPWTRRRRVTLYGRRVMGTSLYLRHHHFPEAYSRIAA